MSSALEETKREIADIVRSVYDALPPGGVFLAYQVRDRVEHLGRKVFGPARKQIELLAQFGIDAS